MKNLNYEKEFQVASYQTDFLGKVKIPTLLQFFQEIAWEHAELLGFGFSDLIKDNLIWFLVRQKVKIKKFPRWQEKITVKTRAIGRDKYFWYREFSMIINDNEEIINSLSSWIIIDLNSRRPSRNEGFSGFNISEEEKSVVQKLRKIPAASSHELLYQKSVYYSDLDLNNHVNNSKYIEWILDSYPIEFLSNHNAELIELNYISESRSGEKISVFGDLTDSGHYYSIKNQDNNKELFRSRIIWKKS